MFLDNADVPDDQSDGWTDKLVGQDSMVLLTQVRPYRAFKVIDCFHKKINKVSFKYTIWKINNKGLVSKYIKKRNKTKVVWYWTGWKV